MTSGYPVPTRRVSRLFLLLGLALALGLSAHPAPSFGQSLNCNLLAHVDSLPGSGSSCWGYTDPNTGVEYAIFGNQNGTAIYNISNPSAPRLTGFINGPSSSWREMKTYSSYCYVGTEGGGGLQIINLVNPEAPFLAATHTDSSLSSIHSVTVDSVRARLYANGSNGGCRILDLTNPIDPVQLGRYPANGSGTYIHDSHIRNDTLYAACINIGQMRILNVANPLAITTVVAFASERGATHNAWTTADRRYLLVTDETSGGRVTSWDIETIGSPIQVAGFTADASGDAHNVHVRDNLAYVAHYTSGLQILDVSNPTSLPRVGYYDTYAPGGGLFNGCWGLYCWFQSGTIVLSDIESGMFLVDYIDNRAYVRGVVTDANSTLPIPNAEVKVLQSGAVDTTDALGNYFMVLEAANYDLRASSFGFTPQTINQTLTLGDTAVVDFSLAPIAFGSLNGTFSYPAGAGIPGAIVTIGGTPLADTTDATGAYSFAQVPEGAYTVGLKFWTCLPESAQATISSTLASTQVNFLFDGVKFAYNLEDTSAAGWAVNADATDNATTGLWTRVNPNGTNGGTAQPEDDHTPNPLLKCYVTGQGTVGGGVGDQDVDNGRTTLYSPILDLSTLADPTIEYFRWYINNAGSSPDEDIWKVQISSNGGAPWVTTDSTRTSLAEWKQVRLRVADYVSPTSQVRMRFIAEDAPSGSVVEAGIDDFRVWGRSVIAVGEETGSSGLPAMTFALLPNVPNPFNPKTEFRFDLPSAGQARLAVYSLEGRLVTTLVQEAMTAGRHAVPWNGRDDGGREVASGVYLLKLEAGQQAATRKIVLAK